MNPLAAAALEDVQAQVDDRGIAIDEVGIAGLRTRIDIACRDGSTQPTVATTAMDVDLPADVKGTHMSRFVEALTAQVGPIDPASAIGLAAATRDRLRSSRSRVVFEFPFFLTRSAPVTGMLAQLDYDGRIIAEVVGHECSVTVAVRAPMASLCPCSKEISDYGAHNQRGYVEIDADCEPTDPIWLEDLVELAESAASAPVYPLLKRPDERFLTMQAYENPAFVEDVARDVAVALRADERVVSYSIRVTNHESIHSHNAVAAIRGGRR